MAKKRMFSLEIVDTDAFLDMPHSSQLLYFHLSMRADDDGFVSNPKRVMKLIGSQEDDYKVLLAKRFLISFDSGVVVIKHWRINNYIRSDRYNETTYLDEKSLLQIKQNNSYTESNKLLGIPDVIPLVGIELDKIRLDKKRERKGRFAPPSLKEVQDYIKEKGYSVNAKTFINFYESNGWKVGKNKMVNWESAIMGWETRDKKDSKSNFFKT